jgi:hypothetical protein
MIRPPADPVSRAAAAAPPRGEGTAKAPLAVGVAAARRECDHRRVRTISVTRYLSPLREGGSVPALVEADDCGTYVLKFRGAAQGPKALVAELIAGEIARALGLPIPEIVLAELDPVLGRAEPDPELQAPLRNSGGLNLALDFLPGAIAFDPALGTPDVTLASRIVWFDAYVTNVDRTRRNTNLLLWHRQLYLIDHGAALLYQHDPETFVSRSQSRFAQVRDHVLLPFARELEAADAALAPLLTEERLRAIVDAVPEAWLEELPRARYLEFLLERLAAPRAFVDEAAHARV